MEDHTIAATATPNAIATTTTTPNATKDAVAEATISALLEINSSHRAPKSQTKQQQQQNTTDSSESIINKFQEILPKFSSPLKTNFENRNLWFRFGLTLLLSKESPQSALQVFIECMRIDQTDPLPAMLAAKLLLEDLRDSEKGLDLIRQAIYRCKQLQMVHSRPESISSFSSLASTTSSSSSSSANSKILETKQRLHITNEQATPSKLSNPSSCNYKNIAPLLSRCYLLAAVMHAHIYERKPESIRTFDTFKLNLDDSQKFLDLARDTHKDHLIYFHKALHDASKRSFHAAIDNLRQAIEFNHNHLPSMQLLILSLSAIGHLNEALILCESSLHEFVDNLLLLYIKCNLEQRLVETKGYKSALATAQHMLKCFRQSSRIDNFSRGTSSTTTATLAANSLTSAITTPANTAAATTGPTGTLNHNHQTISASANIVLTSPLSLDAKQVSANLFANEIVENIEFNGFIGDELSIWLLVAEIFVKIGSFEDAELCVDEGAKHADGALSYRVMFIRGLIAKAKQNLMEAKTFFQSCLALCPRHAKALQQLGHVHYMLRKFSTAEKFLRDSLDADGSCSKSWDYLRFVYIEQKQYDRAKQCEKEYETLEESSPIVPISAISRLTLQ